MKVSREQVAENRTRILDAAGRLFRARGFADVSVAEVMQAAGMTHGGFYNHFKSKDDLIARVLEHVTGQDAGPGFDLARYADAYLSPAHCLDRAGGCPIAALGTEAGAPVGRRPRRDVGQPEASDRALRRVRPRCVRTGRLRAEPL